MPLGELAGYAASGLVFATFCVRTMIPLRMMAIGSNVAFISYAIVEGLAPVFILHAALLPVNLYRLREIGKLKNSIQTARSEDAPIDAIIPFMQDKTLSKGEFLFKKGDHATRMYFLLEGKVRIVEMHQVLTKGAIIGEIGLFSAARKRSASAIADADSRLLSIDDATLYQAYYKNPELGFHLISLIASRFTDYQLASEPNLPAFSTSAYEKAPQRVSEA